MNGGSNPGAAIEHLVAHLRLRNGAAGGYAARQPDIAADHRSATDGDAAQNGRAGVDHYIIFDDGMTRMTFDQGAVFVDGETLGAQSHRLIEPHALADEGGFTNHHAGAVVNEKTAADSRAGMNVDGRWPNGRFPR